MKLGISSYTFGWAVGVCGGEPARRLDEHGLLDKCEELGVKLLQIGDNLPLHTFSPDRLSKLATRAESAGIEIEVGACRLSIEKVAQYVAIANELNARLIRFVIDDAEYHPSMEQIVQTLLGVKSVLEGKTLGIENHDRFQAKTLRRIIEEAESENIGICLDTANSLGAGEGLQSVLSELAPLTVNLHIKDFQIERVPHLMGFSVSGRPAGSGTLKVPLLLEQLATFGRCSTAILELWTPLEKDLVETIAKESAWAIQSVDYLRSYFT